MPSTSIFMEECSLTNHLTLSQDSPVSPGRQGYLFFESDQSDKAQAVDAHTVAGLLQSHQIPIALLNACQSARHAGVEGNLMETSVVERLVAAGAQAALGMSWSVTVSAARVFMERLYQELALHLDRPVPLATAVRNARLSLHQQQARKGAYGFEVKLEDWCLPVLCLNQDIAIELKSPTPAEESDYLEWKGRLGQWGGKHHQEPAHGFFGRDLELLELERRLLSHRNILLLQGMGGAGKSTLLRHAAWWWQATGLVDQVFLFEYDQRAWTAEQIRQSIAQQLLEGEEAKKRFQSLSATAQETRVGDLLRQRRHLVILDNLESITGQELAIRHELSQPERQALQRMLGQWAGAQSLVLLGSRSPEAWLQPGTFEDNRIELGGLDPDAASELSRAVLERHRAAKWLALEDAEQQAALQRLTKLLAGYPLAIEVILPNLARQTPIEVVASLVEGGSDLKMGDTQDKTRNLLRCVDYSFSQLAPQSQRLLLCLAPFTGVLNVNLLPLYLEGLKKEEGLKELKLEELPHLINLLQQLGLMASHQLPGYLRLQPALGYVLRTRWQGDYEHAIRTAIEKSYRELYLQAAEVLTELQQSQDPQQQQTGHFLVAMEFENLTRALHLALSARESILNVYLALSNDYNQRHDEAGGQRMGEKVLAQIRKYPPEALQGRLGLELASVIDNIARRQLKQRNFLQAEQAYQEALKLFDSSEALPAGQKALIIAGILHQLGRVMQEQRRWLEAEDYFQKALAIYIEFQDRFEQAGTLHNLGAVMQEQRRWPEAEDYSQKALAIYIEFKDRFQQASTLHNLGIVMQEHRRWPEAEDYFQKALAIYIEFKDRFQQASTLHNLGIVMQKQQRWPEAEDYFQKALALKIEFQDRFQQAFTLHNLGIVMQEQRRWPEAEDYFQKALAIYIEFKDRFQQASTLHQLSRIMQEQQRWEQARDHGLEALRAAVESNASYEIAVIFRGLSKTWQKSSDPSIPKTVADVLGISTDETETLLRRSNQ